MFRRADDGQRVADIQFAHQIQMEFAARDFKFRRRRAVSDVERMLLMEWPACVLSTS